MQHAVLSVVADLLKAIDGYEVALHRHATCVVTLPEAVQRDTTCCAAYCGLASSRSSLNSQKHMYDCQCSYLEAVVKVTTTCKDMRQIGLLRCCECCSPGDAA